MTTATVVDRECRHCGCSFAVRVSPSRAGRGVFCSPACQRKGRDRSGQTVGTNWRGGRRERADGRIEVYLRPDDPLAGMRASNGYVLEHRLVVARAIGRALLPTESVHHINGDPRDNRLENLQLRVSLSHGAGQVYCCAECGSRNLKPLEI